MLFEGEIRGRGVAGSLRSEMGKSNVQISAKFKMEAREKAADDRGRTVEVAGQEVFWYKSITPKTRQKCVEELQLTGMSAEEAEEFISEAESGSYMQVDGSGFGTKVCSLTVSINRYNENSPKTRVDWINDPSGGGRPSRSEVLVSRLKSSKPGAAGSTAGSSTPQTDAKAKPDAPWMKE